MTLVDRIIADLSPVDVVPLDAVEDDMKRLLLDELDRRGFVVDSRGVLGEVSICSVCSGDGEVKGRACPQCDGFATTCNFGRGQRPYRQ